MSNENIFEAIDDEDEPTHVPLLATVKATKFEMTTAEHDLANAMGLSLGGDVVALVGAAATKTNQALTLVIESGLLLMAASAECERSHTTFKDYLMKYGMPHRRAYEAMSMAKFAAGLPKAQRADMLALPKSKVALLAQADPEVVADLFDDDDTDVNALSVRELKHQIRELKAAKTQSGVERQRAEEKAERLERELKSAQSSRNDITDIVPAEVSDIRLECAALYKKAELSVDGIARLHHEVNLLEGECAEWALSCARSSFAALQSLIAQAKGAAAELHRQYGADLDGDNSTMERLTQKELFSCASEYRQLIAEHEHEAEMRAYGRGLDKPKGKGRPKAAPKTN